MFLEMNKVVGWLGNVPIIGPLFTFPFKVSKEAFFQLFFLWLLSSTPVFFSIVGSILKGKEFVPAILDVLNIQVLFLYTAAFIAPLLYTLVARIVYPRKEKIFKGAGLVFLLAILVFVGSAWAFGNDDFDTQLGTGLHDTITRLSFIIYGFSIYFWFLAIADERNSGEDYHSIVNGDTESFVAATRRESK